jgi:hypothetical protein
MPADSKPLGLDRFAGRDSAEARRQSRDRGVPRAGGTALRRGERAPEPRELGTLAAGEKKATRVPAQAAATKGSRPDLLHVPVSVQIDGKAPDVYFDLDVSTRELGIEIACPDRKH